MATLVGTAAAPREREHGELRFFFIMACVMALTLVGGFGFNVAMGRSTFASPLLVHVHAVVMFGWVALYVLQNWLMYVGHRAWHRKLGWLAVIWVPAVFGFGIAMTLHSLRTAGGPPFFDQAEFLFGNPIGIALALAIVVWAIAVRKDTGWHRRLMFGSMAMLTGPGLGRLLPAPLFIPWAWWVVNIVVLVFPLIGMRADYRRYGKVHPAWYVPIAAILVMLVVGDLLAYSQWGQDFTEQILAGTPGADRQRTAFFPL